MTVVTNIEDLRQIAERRVAKAIYDYVSRGSYDEVTLRGASEIESHYPLYIEDAYR